ncbi:MAG: DUF1062 domain-containing protein [Vallitalea sp.]|jgi:hypothetical protein|nr:DUF1062 domain-containing protein [Vallitalea sp.]
MSYQQIVKWEIIPLTLPMVKKNCCKCGNNSLFINSNKFRVNANKNKLDIWLIYQCEKCKSTWNMSIYERINYKDIDPTIYKLFLNNDIELAKQYGFDIAIHNKNKVNIDYENIEYEIIGEKIDILEENFNKKIILDITCKYPFGLRVDKVLSKKLGVSREKIKKLHKNSLIYGDCKKDLLREKINNNIKIYIG